MSDGVKTAIIAGICSVFAAVAGAWVANKGPVPTSAAELAISINGQEVTVGESDYQKLMNRNADLESENAALLKELEGLQIELERADSISSDSQEEMQESSGRGELSEYSGSSAGYIWDILPEERLNGGKLRLLQNGEHVILSGIKRNGAQFDASFYDEYLYIYTNKEFSRLSFDIGHIDGTKEVNNSYLIQYDGNAVGDWREFSFSAPPQTVELNDIDDVSVVSVKISRNRDGGGRGPGCGIVDIWLEPK